jgi:hypothetical protein
VEPDYLPDSEFLFWSCLDPISLRGVCGGLAPPHLSLGWRRHFMEPLEDNFLGKLTYKIL